MVLPSAQINGRNHNKTYSQQNHQYWNCYESGVRCILGWKHGYEGVWVGAGSRDFTDEVLERWAVGRVLVGGRAYVGGFGKPEWKKSVKLIVIRDFTTLLFTKLYCFFIGLPFLRHSVVHTRLLAYILVLFATLDIIPCHLPLLQPCLDTIFITTIIIRLSFLPPFKGIIWPVGPLEKSIFDS